MKTKQFSITYQIKSAAEKRGLEKSLKRENEDAGVSFKRRNKSAHLKANKNLIEMFITSSSGGPS